MGSTGSYANNNFNVSNQNYHLQGIFNGNDNTANNVTDFATSSTSSSSRCTPTPSTSHNNLKSLSIDSSNKNMSLSHQDSLPTSIVTSAIFQNDAIPSSSSNSNILNQNLLLDEDNNFQSNSLKGDISCLALNNSTAPPNSINKSTNGSNLISATSETGHDFTAAFANSSSIPHIPPPRSINDIWALPLPNSFHSSPSSSFNMFTSQAQQQQLNGNYNLQVSLNSNTNGHPYHQLHHQKNSNSSQNNQMMMVMQHQQPLQQHFPNQLPAHQMLQSYPQHHSSNNVSMLGNFPPNGSSQHFMPAASLSQPSSHATLHW